MTISLLMCLVVNYDACMYALMFFMYVIHMSCTIFFIACQPDFNCNDSSNKGLHDLIFYLNSVQLFFHERV